ncbi:MAG: hypothetical protein HN348_29545, partial [Proteobacteria bacterium]|nr:hypothetical protein [Pseudomonadota bacterium]
MKRLLFLSVFSISTPAFAIDVCDTGCDYTSIGDALSVAQQGDEIDVMAGTYHEYPAAVQEDVTITGEGAASTIVTTMSGASPGPWLTIKSGVELQLEGIAIERDTLNFQKAFLFEPYSTGDLNDIKATGGFATGDGVLSMGAGSVVTIDHGFFMNNHGTAAGVIGVYSGDLTVIDSTFKENSTDTSGGAIQATEMSTIDIHGTLFRANEALDGGAIYVENSDLILDVVELKLNSATASGGAIYISNE